MNNSFFLNERKENRDLYIDLLKVTGSLSNLFTNSENPYLYYRAMENIFCKAFKANNLSRSDISVDAGKNGMGIGLKTFLQENRKSFQKIAEFNKFSYMLKWLKTEDVIRKVSEMRNERILSTQRIGNFNKMMYHLIVRSKRYMAIYEEPMDLIDINKLRIIDKKTDTTIHFTDTRHEYNFNISKSTLLKRFYTTEDKEIYGFEVNILDDPYEFLLTKHNDLQDINRETDNIVDYIILPLYSDRTGNVEEKSGLNQWNAGGRERNANEVYIPIPAWIYKKKRNFFKYVTVDHKTDSFDVKLPNGLNLSMRVAQQGGKSLMSNPNLALGKWILRDVLNLPEGKLVTKEQLDIIGIDSVKLSKINDSLYILDFLQSGSYERFKDNFN